MMRAGGRANPSPAAQVLVETADRLVAEEATPALQQYRVLLGAIRALETAVLPAPPVVDSYLLRALAIAGYAVSPAQCAGCGAAGRSSLQA